MTGVSSHRDCTGMYIKSQIIADFFTLFYFSKHQLIFKWYTTCFALSSVVISQITLTT